MFIFCFFPFFLVGWYVFSKNPSLRLILLLTASYIFYAWWDYRFTLLMAFTTGVNYFAGMAMVKSKRHSAAKAVMVASVILSLAPLFFFKYFPWLGSYLTFFLDGEAKNQYIDFITNIILPVGISFFTFQAMSYSLDLYRGQCAYCSSLLKFSTYVSMFPQLVAGPIIRFRDIDEQLDNVDQLESQVDFSEGLELFFRGLIKKVVFADRIGIIVDPYFVPGAELNTPLAWMAILGYSLQIYFDFSGYSDMAIGMGKCLGLRFPDNFLAPYTARNPAEFWRRWHISLSRWLRNYLYIPLGGNRKGKTRTLQNLMITMLLGGLWHGASWNFVIWGGWHGALLVAHRVAPKNLRDALPAWSAILLLNLGVVIGWVFFRITSFNHAIDFLSVMAGAGNTTRIDIPLILVFIVPLGYFLHFLERRDLDAKFVRGRLYSFLLACVSLLAILELGRDAPFIYFQF